jgi:hypothetical protein
MCLHLAEKKITSRWGMTAPKFRAIIDLAENLLAIELLAGAKV